MLRTRVDRATPGRGATERAVVVWESENSQVKVLPEGPDTVGRPW